MTEVFPRGRCFREGNVHIKRQSQDVLTVIFPWFLRSRNTCWILNPIKVWIKNFLYCYPIKRKIMNLSKSSTYGTRDDGHFSRLKRKESSIWVMRTVWGPRCMHDSSRWASCLLPHSTSLPVGSSYPLGSLPWGIVSIRLACEYFCGTFSWLLICCRRAQPTMGGTVPGQVVLG